MRGERCEHYTVIDDLGFGFELPGTLKPGYWLAPLQPGVRGLPMSPEQRRTDDYGRQATALELTGDLRGDSETHMHLEAEVIRHWVRQAAWLQRAERASLRLLEGSDIELSPKESRSAVAALKVVVVARDRRWLAPDGREVTG